MDEAVSLTWSTLTRRLKNLRSGAIAAGLCAACLIACGIILDWSWFLAIPPALSLSGYFFFRRDQRMVFAWENRVLALWAEEKLVIGLYVLTFDNHPGPLNRTLKNMVAHLPRNADYLPPSEQEARAERCLFWIRSTLQEIRLQRRNALNLALACLPLALCLGYRAGPPWTAAALLILPAALPARAWSVYAGRKRWLKRCRAIAPWKPEPLETFTARLDALDWSRLPKELRMHLYRTIVAGIAP